MISIIRPRLDPFPFIARNILVIVFAIYSFVFIGIVATQMPPYQNLDEANHFFRVEQISRLGLMPQRLPNGVGGAFVDTGIVETAVPFLAIALHPDRKVTSSLYDLSSSVGWGRQLTQVAFPNTAIYPPRYICLPSPAFGLAR